MCSIHPYRSVVAKLFRPVIDLFPLTVSFWIVRSLAGRPEKRQLLTPVWGNPG
jgi:hypothetical protein